MLYVTTLIIILLYLGKCVCILESTDVEDTISVNEESRMILDVIQKFFSQAKCLVIIKDEGRDSLELKKPCGNMYLPTAHILMKQKQELEFKELLIQLLDQGCTDCIITTKQLPKVSPNIYSSVKSSIQKRTRKFLVMIEDSETIEQVIQENELFLKFFPDTVVIRQNTNESIIRNKTTFDLITFAVGDHLLPTNAYVIGTWQSGNYTNNVNLYPDKLSNLQGRQITACFMEYRTYTIIVNDTTFDGFDWRIFNEISRKFNFTLKIIDAGNYFGGPIDNGTVTGYIGFMINGVCNIGLPGAYMENYYYDNFEINRHYLQSGVTFLTPKPKKEGYLWEVLLPFSNVLWKCFVAACMFASSLYYALSRIHHRIFPNQEQSPYISYSYSFLYTVCVFVGLVPKYPKHHFMRHFITWCFFTSMMLITAYNSKLISFLTVPRFEKPIETLQEFADSNYLWGIDDITWKDTFSTIVNTVVKQFKDKYYFSEDHELLNKLASNRELAILVEQLPSGHMCGVDYLYEDTLKVLYVMKEQAITAVNTYIMEKASPLIHKFDKLVSNLDESGLVSYFEREVAKEYSPKMLRHVLEYEPKSEEIILIGMENISGSFIIFALGINVALLAFILENCISCVKYLKVKRRKLNVRERNFILQEHSNFISESNHKPSKRI